MRLTKNFGYLDIPDFTNQIFLILLSIASLILIDTHPERYLIPVLNIILRLIIVYFVSHYEKKSEPERKQRSFTRFLRFWYPVFMILVCFKEMYWITINAHDTLYDDYLIRIDRWIFGTDPAVFLSNFVNPYAVEFLQIIYTFFYIMPLIYTMELYFSHRYEELKYSFFVIFFGFYLSYIGYLLVPAIGPRFTLFDFNMLNFEMPGIFLTDKIRHIIDLTESITSVISVFFIVNVFISDLMMIEFESFEINTPPVSHPFSILIWYSLPITILLKLISTSCALMLLLNIITSIADKVIFVNVLIFVFHYF